MQVSVHLDRPLGPIRPLHGVNNGPVGYGGLVDVGHHYRALAIPHVRLHDANWPHPREVDIPQIFPDFSADPDDPASYRFARTDDYLQRILDTGASIIYRLGTSIEHTARKDYTHPPADFAKRARICCNILRHYNHGWANGFHHGIGYWEIWNEPDLGDRMWSGTTEQYVELYETTARAIRATDATVKVGGPGAVTWQAELVKKLLAHCRDRDVPLDFLSWHAYRRSPAAIATEARAARAMLDSYGFTHAESHLNEWNYVDFDWGQVFKQGNEQMRRDGFERQKNEVGASFAAGTLIALQDAAVDVGCYYDGQPMALFCGLFDYYGVAQKTCHAFAAFRTLLDLPQRVAVDVTRDEAAGEFYALAAADDARTQLAVLISNFGGTPGTATLTFGDAKQRPTAVHVRLIDRTRDFTPLPDIVPDAAGAIRIPLERHAVALVQLTLA